MPILDTVLDLGGTLIERLFPDKTEQQKAKLELMRLAQEGEFKALEERMQTIRTEASSEDPWTSRARPTFLYVIYVYLLAGIPMGVLSIFSPAHATAVGKGMGAWLDAIPPELYALFGAGYLGYATARSVDKKTRNKLKDQFNASF